MEKYQSVKFKYRRTGESFPYDRRLTILNRWGYIFSQLGLTPVHSDGAYGNRSFRTGFTSFLITRSGMPPTEPLIPENYSPKKGVEEWQIWANFQHPLDVIYAIIFRFSLLLMD